MIPLCHIEDIGVNLQQDSDGRLQLGRENRADSERISPSLRIPATDTQSNAAGQVRFESCIVKARRLVEGFG